MHCVGREQSRRPVAEIIAAAVAADIDEHRVDTFSAKRREAVRHLSQPCGVDHVLNRRSGGRNDGGGVQRRPRCEAESRIFGGAEPRDANQTEAFLTDDDRAGAEGARKAYQSRCAKTFPLRH